MGSIVINGMRIRDSKPHGILSVAVSSPIPATSELKIALRLGEDRFYKYNSRLRIRSADRHRLPGETRA